MRFREGLASVLLIAAGWRSAAAAGEPAASIFAERVDVNVVNVEVYVTDREGRPVAGLTRSDFQVLEDGRPVELTNFSEVSVGETVAAGGEPAPPPAAPAPPAPPPASAPGAPALLVVYVDQEHVGAGSRNRMLDEARRFLSDRLALGDRAMLVEAGSTVRVRVPPTRDPAALEAGLDALAHSVGRQTMVDSERREIVRQLEDEAGPDAQTRQGVAFEILSAIRSLAEAQRVESRRSLAALETFVGSLAAVPGRKVVLHVSEGIPLSPARDLYESWSRRFGDLARAVGGESPELEAAPTLLEASFRDMVAHANANGVTFFPIDAAGSGRGFESISAERGGVDTNGERMLTAGDEELRTQELEGPLSRMAVATGGFPILRGNRLVPRLAGVARSLDNYYSLGYAAPHSGDGRQHTIGVRVPGRSDLTLRYRRGYLDKGEERKLEDRALSALLLGAQDNPLGIVVRVGRPEPRRGRGSRLPLRVQVPIGNLALLPHGAVREGSFEVLVSFRTGSGPVAVGKVQKVEVRIPEKDYEKAVGELYSATLAIDIGGGDPRLAIAVRDGVSAVTSFVAHDLRLGARR